MKEVATIQGAATMQGEASSKGRQWSRKRKSCDTLKCFYNVAQVTILNNFMRFKIVD